MVPSPGGPVPTPTPMPFSGELSGGLSGLSANVLVEGKPAAVQGSSAANTPERSRPAGGLGETSRRLEIPRELLKPPTMAPPAAPPQAAASPPAPAAPIPPASGPAPVTDPLESALPLARYARLCAELALSPHEADAILRRYRLERVEERRAPVGAAWKKRFRQEPSHYDMWEVMYQRYIDWLKRRTLTAR